MMKLKKWIAISILFFSNPFVFAQELGMKRYIITETGKNTSLDPLDADQTHNLPVARMIYSTPLEISINNELTSTVLDSFKTHDDGKGIEFNVKQDAQFSDSTPLTAEDIVFAIARMTWKRPTFPVLENIDGTEKWLEEKHPLKSIPKGIKIEGRKITILFSKKVHKPLFRFCLELFSIIPKSCVNLETGKISCDNIPSSGHYKIESQGTDWVQFGRTSLGEESFKGPRQIRFVYWHSATLSDRLSEIKDTDVIAGNESMFSYKQMDKFTSEQKVLFLPAARFTDLDLNPDVDFFKDKKCRQVFADIFRKSFGIVSKKYTQVEASIFTRLIPGFMTAEELRAKEFSKIKSTDLEDCKKKLALKPFRWGYVDSEKNSAFVEALEMTLNELKYSGPAPIIAKTRKELYTLFGEGKLGIVNGGSGFWAHDPVGDLQMLFTPNLHKSLDFITKDQTLQALIRDLRDDPSNKSKMLKVNQYIHDEALFNVYSFVRRFYIIRKDNKTVDLPMAVTSPTPWQVFGM